MASDGIRLSRRGRGGVVLGVVIGALLVDACREPVAPDRSGPDVPNGDPSVGAEWHQANNGAGESRGEPMLIELDGQDGSRRGESASLQGGTFRSFVIHRERDVDGDGAWDQVFVQENRSSSPEVGEQDPAYAESFDLMVMLQVETDGLPSFQEPQRLVRFDRRPLDLVVEDRDGDGHPDIVVKFAAEDVVLLNDGAGGFTLP